jgi:hypothetical protein
MPPAGGGHEFDQRHLTQAFHHPGPDVALPAGDVAGVVVIGGVIDRTSTARRRSRARG